MSTQTSMKSHTQFQPIAQGRTTIVQRVSRSTPGHMGRMGSYSYSMSSSRAPTLSAGTYQSLSSSGVANVRESRQKEKKEMQGLNERFATYIEQVRYLEARCKMLEDQLNQLSGREKYDLEPIKEMIRNELDQARKIIDEMAKEKAGVDSKIAGLTEEIQRLLELLEIHERHKKDYVSKINQLNSQIGEYEGELADNRLRIRSLEDENDKCRELLRKANDEIKKLRADLDNETEAHIIAANAAQTAEEENEFLRLLLEKLPEDSSQPLKIEGIDAQHWWKNQFSGAIRDLQNEYDKVAEQMKMDMEARMNIQLEQMQRGTVKENLESSHLREEVKKLKGQLSDKTGALNDAEARIRTLESEMGEYMRSLNETKRELDELRMKYESDMSRLSGELECCLQELQLIMDAKLSLELEIACYRQLLEGEENRAGLKQIVEQAVGVQSSSGSKLSEFISSSGGSSSMTSEASGRLTQSRSSRGPISFVEASVDGSSITIENNTSGSKAKAQSMSGWKLKKQAPGKQDIVYNFGNVTLSPGQKYKIFAKGSKPGPGEHVGSEYCVNEDCFSWGVGTGNTVLFDDHASEKATVKSTLSGIK